MGVISLDTIKCSEKPNMMMIFISNVQDSIMEYFDPNYVNEELNYLDDPLDDFD